MVKNEQKIRLAKYIADSGLYSRRSAELLIESGEVKLDGQIYKNYLIKLEDLDKKLTVKNKLVKAVPKILIYKYHKRAGLMTTTKDPENRKTIYDVIKLKNPNLAKFKTIGRLDYNTSGLLLLTNNGDIARILELPSNEFERIYQLNIWGKYDINLLKIKIFEGITIDGINYKSIKMDIIKKYNNNYLVELLLKEGKNREIRKIFAHYNFKIRFLTRTKFGPISLGNLLEDEIKELDEDEYNNLKISLKIKEKYFSNL